MRMISKSSLINSYYLVKPFIPRYLQIKLRRKVVSQKRLKYLHVWPIDDKAANPPKGWAGWPDRKQFALVLHHDVDTAIGHEKCHHLVNLEEKMGFRSSFNFVPERYNVSSDLRRYLVEKGFEIGVHGLKHDGKLFLSKERFQTGAIRIRQYLKEWNSVGFVSPSMIRNLDWILELEVKHDTSTFDTDPFEPYADGIGTIFPFWVHDGSPTNGFVELPYTIPQDFTLFVLMKEINIDIWKRKLDWIVEKRGMALLITHPDYMNFNESRCGIEEYPVEFYKEFLGYMKNKYGEQYWHVLPKEIAHFWKQKMVLPKLP
jgi:hypothetical protein